jgi:epsilon-lactone hydrolase
MTDQHKSFALQPQDVKANAQLREKFRQFWADTSEPPRAHYDRFIADTPMALGVETRESVDPLCPGWWCEPASAQGPEAILYIHGGGYVLGSAQAYRGFTSQIAARTRRPVFALEYPLAPEARIPVALDLVGNAIRSLRKDFPALALAGDSAGGGMSLASLARYPGEFKAAAVFSPWTDLGLESESIKEAAPRDLLLAPAYLEEASKSYRGELPASDRRASPLFDVPSTLPPILIQVATDEILRDDGIRYAAAARAAGASVSLEVYQDLHHVFQLNVRELRAARDALDRASAFLVSHLR